MPPHAFALDATQLRYARVVRAEGGVQLADYRRWELPPGTFLGGPLGGPLGDATQFKRLLGTALSELPEKTRSTLSSGSLVVPDAWLRLVFAEVSDLPAADAARDEVLRWKLQRLVPFRVEDLRVRGLEVAPLAGQSESRRLLLGFAMELLLAQLEQCFAELGIVLGQITNQSLALAGALASADAEPPSLLVVVHDGGYSLLFAQAGEPRLYRYKALDAELDPSVVAALVRRELVLTHSFIREHLAALPQLRVVLASPPHRQAPWLDHLMRTPGIEPVLLDESVLPLASPPAALAGAWHEAAPMLGAALQLVA